MIITPHLWTGALVGKTIGQKHKLLALALSVGSHFLLDGLPHWNPKYPEGVFSQDMVILTSDALVSIAGLAVTKKNLSSFAWLCGFLAILPDVLGIWETREHPLWFDYYVAFDKKIQNHTKPLPGMTTQVIYALFVFYFLLQPNRKKN